MTRVATFAQQSQLIAAMQQNQQRVALATLQVATGKRGDSYDDLGLDAVRQVRLSGVLAREEAYVAAGGRAAARLEAQDLQLGQLRDTALGLRDAILGALAAGEARGLDTAIEAAFQSFRSVLNADHGGRALFGGGIDGEAFLPASLAELVALPSVSEAFANGPLSDAAVVGDGQVLTTGFLADAIGGPLAEALRALGSLGPIDGPLDPAATAALTALLPGLDTAVEAANLAQAENGARLNAAEAAVSAARDRAAGLEIALSDIENIDPAEAISRLQAEQLALQASYRVLSDIGRLSLVNFI